MLANRYNIDNILGNNIIHLPQGLDHGSNSFLSLGDKVGKVARARLFQSGRLRFGTVQQHFELLKSHYVRNEKSQESTRRVGAIEGIFIHKWLETLERIAKETNCDRLFIWYRAFLANKRV